MMIRKYPWSSCGTNAVGTWLYMNTVAASPAPNSTRNTVRIFTTHVTATAYHEITLLISASMGFRKKPWMPVLCVSLRSKIAARAGERVSALNAEIAIENAMVSENCLYRMPVVPGKKLTGTNTEISTSDVATTALVTSRMAAEVASIALAAPSSRCRCTFSMTTIASSTTNPVASVMPNSVSELIEKPNILMNANVPISDTGIVTAGMIVARQSCRNRKMTTMTIRIASPIVRSTSLMESETTRVVSTATMPFMPGGNDFCSSANTARHFRSTSSALALESCWMPTPTASPPPKELAKNLSSVL